MSALDDLIAADSGRAVAAPLAGLDALIARDSGKSTGAAPADTSPSIWDTIKQVALSAGKGVASGFADVGNTIINSGTKAAAAAIPSAPSILFDPEFQRRQTLSGLVSGQPPQSLAEVKNAQRQAGLDAFNKENDSTAFSVGRIVGNVAATWPVGGVVGGLVKGAAALPMLGRAAPVLDALGTSMSSGGMATGLSPTTLAGQAGNVGMRVAGGAASGGASASMIDPSSAAGGALVGGIIPPVAAGIGRAAGMVRSGVQALRTPEAVRAADSIMTAGGYTTPQQIAGVRSLLDAQGPNIVSEGATVPQLLQNPGISQLQRTLRNSGDTALLNREAAQDTARFAALDRVSPVTGTVQQSAENFGNTLGPQVISADKLAQQNVRSAFQAVDPTNVTRLNLPIGGMQKSYNTFLGPGTVGTGGNATQVLQTARNLAGTPTSGLGLMNNGTGSAPFQTVQNLRSSAGELANQATNKGANKEAAALNGMVGNLDAQINRAASGNAEAGEFFPQAAADQYRAALAAHQDRMLTFRTGPQQSIFQQGGDGLPQAQGAELAPKFFSPRLSQADDAAAFQRIASSDSSTLLKNYAITDAANQTNRLSQLSNSKFSNWMDGRSGAINGLFTDAERAQLTGVQGSLGRADAATSLGMATGSNTAQNVQSAMGLGMLDNGALNAAAKRIPYLRGVTRPLLEAMQESARNGKVQSMGGLLADPDALSKALAARQKLNGQSPIGLLEFLQQSRLPLAAPGIAASGSDLQ